MAIEDSEWGVAGAGVGQPRLGPILRAILILVYAAAVSARMPSGRKRQPAASSGAHPVGGHSAGLPTRQPLKVFAASSIGSEERKKTWKKGSET